MSDLVESTRSRIRASKACTACRQVKLRCDVSNQFPGPCTRCKSTGRVCKVDPSFKRTSTRHQLEQVTSQLADLKQRVGMPSQGLVASPVLADAFDSIVEHIQTRNGSSQLPTDSAGTLAPAIESSATFDDMFGLRTVKIEDIDSARLGSEEIDAEQIYSLFSFFTQHQYDYLPALDTRLPINIIQKSHRLLFWTIIMTAGRYHHTHHNIASSLKEAYHELLAKSLVKAPLPLSSIQAILLLCYWPYPCQKQIFDPSWNLYGIALNAARFLGLNTSMEKLSPKTSREDYLVRARAWLSCFHVGTILALHWGVPLPISSASDLQQTRCLLETCTAPSMFVNQLKIHYEIAQYRILLANDRSRGLTLSASRLFEAKIDEIGRSTSQSDTASEICQLRAKLSLYIIALMLTRSEAGGSQISSGEFSTSITLITIAGLHAASRLIYAFSALCEKVAADTGYDTDTQAQTVESVPLLCVPKQYFTAASIATFFLVTFCMANDQINREDKVMAENMIKMSYQLFDRCSNFPKDEAARTAAVIQAISTAGPWDMVVIDRECASVWFDACRRAGDLRGRDAREKFPEALTTGSQIDDDENGSLAGPSKVTGTSVPSFDDLDEWLTLPEFPDLNWSSGDYDIFGSVTSSFI